MDCLEMGLKVEMDGWVMKWKHSSMSILTYWCSYIGRNIKVSKNVYFPIHIFDLCCEIWQYE